MKSVGFLAAGMCFLIGTADVSAQNYRSFDGTARVIDGDTIGIRGQRIRIAAIDACELAQTGIKRGIEWPCGLISRSFLAKWIDGKHVHCAVIDRDQYNRLVAQCYYGESDIGLTMIAEGMAEILFKYLPRQHGIDLNRYRKAEDRAKELMLGMWAVEIEAPSQYRKQRR